MKKLTARERERDQELERRIVAADIPAYFTTKEDERPELFIRQGFDGYESRVFGVHGGGGFIIPLTISPNIPAFALSDVDLRLARWPNLLFRLLEDHSRGMWPHYQFYGASGQKFDRSETINRFIEQRKEIYRGHFIRGFLLARSLDPMPDDLVLGEVLHGSIIIFDQLERRHCEEITLRVGHRAKPLRKPDPKRPGLFARPDSRASTTEGAMVGGGVPPRK